MKRKPRVDADRLLEKFSGNEGLTDNLADDEAKVMLQWLRGAARARLAAARDDADGERIVAELRTRAKKLGAMIAARCYDADDQAAQRAWSDLGLAQDFKTLPAADASTALRQLLAWEDARHA